MKKLYALLLMAVMACVVFTGCSDPLYEDFENYLNVEMVDVNANYELITAEVATWAEAEDIAEFSASINEVLLPIIEDSLTKLEGINPETEEVKVLKDKYVKVIEAYKEAFELVDAAVTAEDADLMNDGNAKLEEGIELLNDYNAGLEELAAQVGAEIEY